MAKSIYSAIGLMSGSSLDGIDLVYCQFEEEGGQWKYEIVHSDFTPYPNKWKLRLRNLVLQNAITYLKTHTFYGHYLGEVINEFIKKYDLADKVDFIASHGQTIFHQPDNLLTSQIGDGAAIASKTHLPVICNFRNTDVALRGQGAPIVPVGDRHLFADYRLCLNLGGIANISCKVSPAYIIAYDICANNLILNRLAGRLQLEYDEDGKHAAQGVVHEELLEELNNSWYYKKEYPKSLSGGWVNKVIIPIFKRFRMSPQDHLRTAVEHIAYQIGQDIKRIYQHEQIRNHQDKMLVTGGGAFNKFLIQRLAQHSPVDLVIPDSQTIEFKEALIMAFVGALRIRQEPNCLKSVTGADYDNIGGAIYAAN